MATTQQRAKILAEYMRSVEADSDGGSDGAPRGDEFRCLDLRKKGRRCIAGDGYMPAGSRVLSYHATMEQCREHCLQPDPRAAMQKVSQVLDQPVSVARKAAQKARRRKSRVTRRQRERVEKREADHVQQQGLSMFEPHVPPAPPPRAPMARAPAAHAPSYDDDFLDYDPPSPRDYSYSHNRGDPGHGEDGLS